MIKSVMIGFIPGIMFGIEWDYELGFVVIDLGIFRIVWDYVGWEVTPVQQAQQALKDPKSD